MMRLFAHKVAWMSLKRASITSSTILVFIVTLLIGSPVSSAATLALAYRIPPFDCNALSADSATGVAIGYVEVNQGIEIEGTITNYIAGRSTAVLVHVCVRQGQRATISGRVVVSVSGSTVATLNATRSLSFNGTGVVAQPGVLVFEPFVVPTVGQANLQVTIFDSSAAANTLAASIKTLTVIDIVQPEFYYVRINLLTNQHGLPVAEVVGTPGGDAFLKAALPLDDQAKWHYKELVNGGISISTEIDANNNGILNLGAEQDSLMRSLSLRRSMIGIQVERDDRQETVGPTELTFLYGWLDDSNSECLVAGRCIVAENGLALIKGRVGFGSTTPSKGQQTYIHEVLHNIGLDHTPNPITANGWDVSKHLPGGWDVRGLNQRKRPSFASVMNEKHGSGTNNSWIAITAYGDILRYYSSDLLRNFVTEWPTCDGQGRIGEPCILQNNILFRGALDESGVKLVRSAPAFQSSWYSQPTYTYSSLAQTEQPQTETFARILQTNQLPFALVFRDQENRIRAEAPFDARTATNPDDGSDGLRYGAFEVIVPASMVRNAAQVSIRNINGDEVPYQTRTRNTPSINFVNLESGDLLGSQLVVEVFDEDNRGIGELECNFAYSPDDGDTWQPLAVGIPCTDGEKLVVEIEPQDLPASNGFAEIQAFVSDGLNTDRNSVFDLTVRNDTDFWRAYRVMAGDVDGDGKTDLIWNQTTHQNLVTAGLSNGDGSFRFTGFQTMPGTGWGDFKTLVGDVNGDGAADLIWNETTEKNRIYVGLSNKDGTFRFIGPQNAPGSGWNDFKTLTGDINADGLTDLIWNETADKNRIYIGLSNGDGTFRILPFQDHPQRGWQTYKTLVGDVNGDGRSDLIWNRTGADKNRIYVGLSTGTGVIEFLPAQDQNGGGWADYKTLLGDVNNDGLTDLIWNRTHEPKNRIYVGLSDGKGMFDFQRSQDRHDTNWDGYRPIAGDVNGDGRTDLIWNLTSDINRIYVGLSAVDNVFALSLPQERPEKIWYDYITLSGDVNGDGRTDLIWNETTNKNRIYVALAGEDGSFTFPPFQDRP